MAFKPPDKITEAGAETGVKKASLRPDKIIVAGFLAGAYIALAGIVSIAVSSGMDPEIWGTLPTFFSGTVFALGLILVVIAGSELLTGNMALVPLAAMRGRVPIRKLFENFGWVTLGNLLGSLFVAYFLAVKSGVLTADLVLEKLQATGVKKGIDETSGEIFLRAIGCNWLVCLAVWMALSAEDIAGKVLAIFFPIMAFVAIGFDHVVANMFFIPAAIFAGGTDLTWWDAIHNWIFAFLGNLAGAAIFVAGAYYYLYGRPEPKDEEHEGAGDTERTPSGRFAGDTAPAGAADGNGRTETGTLADQR